MGGGLVLAAVVPAVVAVLLLLSAALHRPLLARTLPQTSGANAQRLTVVWGLALLVIAAVQAASAIAGVGAITSAGGIAARFAFALLAEIVVLGWTVAYLRRIAGTDQLSLHDV